MLDEDDDDDRVTALDRVVVRLVAGLVRLRERPEASAPRSAQAHVLGRPRRHGRPASL